MASLTPDETILGLLAAQSRHGYDLLEYFRSSQHLGRVWNLSTSQIYAVLKRLQREGWLVGRELISANAPARTEYALTEAGKERLLAWLYESQPSASIRRIRVEFLSRLYIAQQLNLVIEPIVRCQREACQRQHRELAAARRDAESGMDVLALDLNISQIEAVIGWIERCEELWFTRGSS